MKKMTFLILAAFLTTFTFTVNSFAQDYRTLTGHTDLVRHVAFSPDGSRIATASDDKIVRLWNVSTSGLLHMLRGHTNEVFSMAFSPDNKTIASGSDEEIRLWNANTGRHIRTLEVPTDTIWSLAFSPDGSTIASGSWQEIRLWNANTGRHIHTIADNGGDVGSIMFSPDGRTIAYESRSGTIRLRDANTDRNIHTFTGHTAAVNSVAFSPDGQMLASGSDDATVRLWNARTGVHLRTFSGHTGGVSSVDFSPDGGVLASGSDDATVRLWDVGTGVHLRTLLGHVNWVWSVDFSPDGRILASAGGDGTVLLWEFTPLTISNTTVNLSPSSIQSPPIGNQLKLSLTITAGEDVAGYQATVSYDTSALRYVSSENGDYLPTGAFFVPPVVAGNKVTLAATSLAGESNGDGTLATLTFEVVAIKASTLTLSDVLLTNSAGESSQPEVEATQIAVSATPSTTVRISSGPVSSPTVGELFTLPLTIVAGENVAGYQATLSYDTSALRYVSSQNGDYLPAGAFFLSPIVEGNTITLAATSLAGESNGDGTLATLTFEVIAVKASTLQLSDVLLTNNAGESSRPEVEVTQITESAPPSNRIDVTLPSDLISEVAFGTNLTYFVLNAKFPTLTGVDSTNVIYRDCTITLDLEGVPDNSLSDRLLPNLLEYLRQAEKRVLPTNPILFMAKEFAVNSGILDVFPDEPQYFIFSLKTAAEKAREVEAEADTNLLIATVSVLAGFIPNAGDLLSLGVTFGSIEYKRVLAIDDLLKSTMDPKIRLTNSTNDPGRPDDELRFVLMLPNRVTDIKLKVEQKYSLKSDRAVPRYPVYTVMREETKNLENSAFAGPHAQPISLSDYPSFQLLPPEVQDYLLRHFSVFANFEGLRVPKETSLLPNYPNPFNPETWIPYQLAAPTDVSISIYAADGRLIRTLDFGHQSAGIYESRSRAAYWDGRNAFGEPVASGVYFYTLTAGEFTATRKLLIKK